MPKPTDAGDAHPDHRLEVATNIVKGLADIPVGFQLLLRDRTAASLLAFRCTVVSHSACEVNLIPGAVLSCSKQW